MLLNCDELRQYMAAIALTYFPQTPFPRRALIHLTTAFLKHDRLWETDDDGPSLSSTGVSKGMGMIDWQVSELARQGRLERLSRGTWRVRW